MKKAGSEPAAAGGARARGPQEPCQTLDSFPQPYRQLLGEAQVFTLFFLPPQATASMGSCVQPQFLP